MKFYFSIFRISLFVFYTMTPIGYRWGTVEKGNFSPKTDFQIIVVEEMIL